MVITILSPSGPSSVLVVLKQDWYEARFEAKSMSGLRLLPLVRLLRLVIKLVAAHSAALGSGALIVTMPERVCSRFGV